MNKPNKPRFTTILQQARKQCMKEFDAYEMQTQGNLIAKFFASGMEYRMSHDYVVAERAFLSSRNQAEFLFGYLQGKGADAEMLSAIEGECRSCRNGLSEDRCWVDVFTKGLFYEEHYLEQNTELQSNTARHFSLDKSVKNGLNDRQALTEKSMNKLTGHFLRDPKTDLLWLNNYTYSTEYVIRTIADLWDLDNLQQVNAEIVSGKSCFISESTIELLVAKDKVGNYAVLTLFIDSLGFGGIYVSITSGFTFKSVYCFNEDIDIYIIGEDLDGKWGIMRVSQNASSSPLRARGSFTQTEIIPFQYERMEEALEWCKAAKRAKKEGLFLDITKPTEEMMEFINNGGSWGKTLGEVRSEALGY